MRTYQVYVQGRPTSVGLTPPARPLWQGQPIASQWSSLGGASMQLVDPVPTAESDSNHARD